MNLANYNLETWFHLLENYYPIDQEYSWRNKQAWGMSTYQGNGNGLLSLKYPKHCHNLIFTI